MPHYTNNNILVVTYEELVPRFYKTQEYLKVFVSICEKRGFGLKRVARGHNGGQALIAFDSLPEKVRNQMNDLRLGEHVLEQFFEVDIEAVGFYRDFRFGDGRSISEGGKDGERDLQSIYVANASVIKAVLKLKEARINEIRSKGHLPKKIWDSLTSDMILFCYPTINEKGNEVASVLERKFGLRCDLPEHPKRFKDKCERFIEDGYVSLISDRHGNNNARVNDDKTQALLESLHAGIGIKPNYVEVKRLYESFLCGYKEAINNTTGEIYDPKEYSALSEGSIKRFLSSWKSKIGTHALRSGDRQKYMGNFMVAATMKRSKYAGSLLSVDDRQPPFKYRLAGTSATNRVWFYVAVDHHSECYIAWVHGKSKEDIIIPFYRQVVRSCFAMGVGLPLELECESSLNSTLRNGFLREGDAFKYVRMEANKARGKFVERYNGKVRYEVERHQEGFIARQHARLESNQPGAEDVPIRPYEDIVEQTVRNYQNHNNSPHSIYTDKTRMQVFLENQNPQINKELPWRGILPHIGYKTESSCRVGQVKLQGGEWFLGDFGEIYFGENLINLLNLVEGENIDVRWLDDNEGNVMKAFVYMGGNYICELLPKPIFARARAEQTEEDLIAYETFCKYKTTVDAFGKRRRKAIQRITLIDTEAPVHTEFDINSLVPVVRTDTPAELDGVSDAVVLPNPPSDENKFMLEPCGVDFEPELKDIF